MFAATPPATITFLIPSSTIAFLTFVIIDSIATVWNEVAKYYPYYKQARKETSIQMVGCTKCFEPPPTDKVGSCKRCTQMNGVLWQVGWAAKISYEASKY